MNPQKKSTAVLKSGMHFDAELDGVTIPLDTVPDFGGQGKGVRPKLLVLTALVGCTGMDMIHLLRKMRAEPEELSVEAEAQVSDTQPIVFTDVKVTFRLKGGAVTQAKAEKAAAAG